MTKYADSDMICSLRDYRGVHIDMFVPSKEDYIQKYIRGHRLSPSHDMLMAVLPYIPRAPVVVDLGAHIGTTVMWFYQYADASRIIAVEPNCAVFDILKKNIEINGLQEVILPVNKAVGDEEGFVSMAFTKAVNTGNTIFAECPDGTPNAVQCTTVDSIIANDQHVDLMKIDVEGGELRVLKGARETIARTRPIIIIEIWSPGYRYVLDPSIVTGTNYMDVLRFFSGMHYVIEKRFSGDNYLFIPEEKIQ